MLVAAALVGFAPRAWAHVSAGSGATQASGGSFTPFLSLAAGHADECLHEWRVENGNRQRSGGREDRLQECVDGDPSCDFDEAEGACEFHVSVCAAVDDPRLIDRRTGAKACAPAGIGDVQVKKPASDAASSSPADAANRSALLAALAEVQTGDNAQVCSRDFTLRVPLRQRGSRWKPAQARVVTAARALATGGKPRVDRDALTFRCRPAPQ